MFALSHFAPESHLLSITSDHFESKVDTTLIFTCGVSLLWCPPQIKDWLTVSLNKLTGLTLFAPAYLSVSKHQGGYIVPPWSLDTLK